MISIALEEIPEALAQIIRQLGENEEIVLTENQRPVARLTPLPSAPGRARRGSMKDMIVSIAPDFDATPETAIPWWEKIAGTFADSEEYEEAMRLGREYRESLRPKDDEDAV